MVMDTTQALKPPLYRSLDISELVRYSVKSAAGFLGARIWSSEAFSAKDHQQMRPMRRENPVALIPEVSP